MANFHFTNLQVGASDAPYPGAEATLDIKLSDRQNSGWGKLGATIASVLGVEIDYLDIDQLRNQVLHMLRHDNVQYGQDREGNPLIGVSWELVEILQPGAVVTWKHVALAPPPTAPPISPPIAVPVVAAPAAVAAAPTAPVVATAAAAPAPAVGAVTPEQQALIHLHGKSLGQFFQAALPDPIIRQDPNLSNSILNNTFVEAQKLSGVVTEEADGTFIVKGM